MTNQPDTPRFILPPPDMIPPVLLSQAVSSSSNASEDQDKDQEFRPPHPPHPPTEAAYLPTSHQLQLVNSIVKQHNAGFVFSPPTINIEQELLGAINDTRFLFGKNKNKIQTLLLSFLSSVRGDFTAQTSGMMNNVNAYESLTQIASVAEINAMFETQKARASKEFAQAYKTGQDELTAALKDLYQIHEEEINKLNKDTAKKQQELRTLEVDIFELVREKKQLVGEVKQAELDKVSLYEFFNPASTSIELKEELADTKDRVKELVRRKKAVKATNSLTFGGSSVEGKKFTDNFVTAMLAAYNSEVENAIIEAKRSRNIQAAFDKVEKAKAKIERAGQKIDAEITDSYHKLRLKEVELAFKHLARQEQERDEQAEERRVLREEQAAERILRKQEEAFERAEKQAQRELQEALAKIESARLIALEKEGSHLENVLSQVDPELAEKDAEIIALRQRLAEVQAGKKKNADQLANMRAGYVYVISNKGSFGEGVVKIGMTRRADPMDRVKELGDASVPFHFAVHMLHFSKDAFGLENKLHKKFAAESVNKVNKRKEFFRVHPLEVQAAIQELAEGTTVTFEEDAISPDYAESLAFEAALR